VASKKITEMSLKSAMVDADLFTIVDSETGVLAEQNKSVLRSVALNGYVLEASLGEAALLDVGTTSGTVAAGNAPAAAAASGVSDHESTFAHVNLPTASQKAGLNAAPTLSGVNPVATIADIPADELTADELAAINGANAPDAGNVFATMDDLSAAGGGTVTSVAVSGSDGIEVDSGSPVTTAGTIALGVNAATLRSTINVEDGASADQTAQEIATAIDADTTAETTLKAALAVPANPVQSTDATTIAVVSALPGTPDANTLYFVTA
jgi:hypothetical protein